MLLQDKTALVFAATGGVGSAVARRLAREGARLFLTGRNEPALAALGNELGATPEVAARPPITNALARPLHVGGTAAAIGLVASEAASGIAGQVVNVCAGTVVSR